jgi:hypothetical protein
MRILIDLQGAQTESRFRGIGRYSLSIAQAIARNAGRHEVWLALSGAFPDSLNQLRAAFDGLVPPERICVFDVPRPVAEHETTNRWRARAAEHVRAHFLAEMQADVILLTSLFEGYVDDAVTCIDKTIPGARTAAILYDLIPYLKPEVYLPTTLLRQYYDRKIASLRNADLLLSISAYSREEAVATLGLHAVSGRIDERFARAPAHSPRHPHVCARRVRPSQEFRWPHPRLRTAAGTVSRGLPARHREQGQPRRPGQPAEDRSGGWIA